MAAKALDSEVSKLLFLINFRAVTNSLCSCEIINLGILSIDIRPPQWTG
jgi:hypothetical protein